MKSKTTKAWVPPRGIRYKFNKGRPKPFLLLWSDDEGKETSTAYEDESARELAARTLAEKRQTGGDAVLRFDPEKWRRYLEFQKLVGEKTDPIIVAHEWLNSKQGKPSASGLTVSEAVPKYIELRDQEKSWGNDTKRHAVKHLARLKELFGAKRLNEVGADDVRGWLFGTKTEEGKTVGHLRDDDGELIGAHGQRDHLKNVRVFFSYAIRESWGALANPCEWIKPPKAEDGDPVVIPLRDAFEFFKANAAERLIGRVGMEAFGGIRYGTAGQIQKDAINFDRRGIRMAWRIHKTGKKDQRNRYRQGQPENLWDWLKHAPEDCWKMTSLEYREAKRYALVRANLRPIENLSEKDEEKIKGLRNIWRHSFISYHLARYKTLPLTQYLAQHSSPQMTEDYEGMADEIDAARYFMITPETVKLTWEQFMALPIPPLKPLDSSAVAQIIGG